MSIHPMFAWVRPMGRGVLRPAQAQPLRAPGAVPRRAHRLRRRAGGQAGRDVGLSRLRGYVRVAGKVRGTSKGMQEGDGVSEEHLIFLVVGILIGIMLLGIGR